MDWEEVIRNLLKHVKLYNVGQYQGDKLDKELTTFFSQVEDRVCAVLKKNGVTCYRDYLKEYPPLKAEALVREDIENWKKLGASGEVFAKLLTISLMFPEVRKMSLPDKIIFFNKILQAEKISQRLKEYLVNQETLFGVDIDKIKGEAEDAKFDEKRVEELEEKIVKFIKKNSKELKLSLNTIRKHFSEEYSPVEIDRAINHLVKSGKGEIIRVSTLFGVNEFLQLTKPKESLEVFIREEVGLTPSERRDLEAVKKTFNVEKPEIVEVDGTKTVIVEYGGEKINVAIGEIKEPKLFEPLSVGERVFQVKKSPSLERIKKKIRERKVEIERPKASIEEYGALEKYAEGKFEEYRKAIETLKKFGAE